VVEAIQSSPRSKAEGIVAMQACRQHTAAGGLIAAIRRFAQTVIPPHALFHVLAPSVGFCGTAGDFRPAHRFWPLPKRRDVAFQEVYHG